MRTTTTDVATEPSGLCFTRCRTGRSSAKSSGLHTSEIQLYLCSNVAFIQVKIRIHLIQLI
jgi:hypothetical protein